MPDLPKKQSNDNLYDCINTNELHYDYACHNDILSGKVSVPDPSHIKDYRPMGHSDVQTTDNPVYGAIVDGDLKMNENEFTNNPLYNVPSGAR